MYTLDDIKKEDPEIASAITDEFERQNSHIELIAGPIVRYRDVAEQLVNRRETLEMFTKGVKLFMVGLAKKVIIANTMGTLTTNIFATTDENGVVGTWLGMIAYTFQIYFDFSGYSDMACGLGNMMGFEF